MINFHSCPFEIHSYIFQLACGDGDSAVHTLLPVSKYFYDVSRPFLYRCLSISGPEQITRFASKLDNEPPHLRQIHHLFISDRPSDHGPESLPLCLDSNAIMRILSLAAPSLESLTFVTSSPTSSTSVIARLFRLSFPRLQELTISGFYPFPTSCKMPRLKRLHLHGNRNPYGLLQVGRLEVAFPQLTHLRISGLSMALTFALELQEALNASNAVPPSTKLPSSISHIVVQPCLLLHSSAKSTTYQAREQLMFDHLAAIQTPECISFTLLQPHDFADVDKMLKQHWADRLAGGNGCWPQ